MAHWTIRPGDWCHIDVINGDRERAKRSMEASSAGSWTCLRARTP